MIRNITTAATKGGFSPEAIQEAIALKGYDKVPPPTAPEVPEAAKAPPTVETEEGVFSYDPGTGGYTRRVGGLPPSAARAGGRGAARVIPATVQKGLTGAGSLADAMDRFTSTFKDEYAGYKVGGGVAQKAKGIFGVDQDEVQFWKDYQSYVNDVRNDRFGAALTATEKAEFEKEIVNPNMHPDTISKTLERQQKVTNKALQRLSKGWATQYDKSAIEAFTGRPIDEKEGKKAITEVAEQLPLAEVFPGRENQIQQALDEGYTEEQIRTFLGGQ
jgi:hypothetical protein